jgi:hypothetical protein
MSDNIKPNGSQPHTRDTPVAAGIVTPATSVSDIAAVIRAFEAALEILREQLAHERTRAEAERDLADRTKQHADREHNRAYSAQQQLTAVQAELIETRVEAAQLRRKLAEPPHPVRRWFTAWRRRQPQPPQQ